MDNLKIRFLIAAFSMLCFSSCAYNYRFNEFIDQYKQNSQKNKACALAYDNKDSWALGASWAQPTIEEASRIAIEKCEQNRLSSGVACPCSMYYVNDFFVYDSAKAQKISNDKASDISQTPINEVLLCRGTGFAINSDGLVATAYHIIEGATSVKVRLPDGNLFNAEVVKSSRVIDIAILRINVKRSHFLRLAPAGLAKSGDKVFIMGFPAVDILGYEPKFNEGNISSLSGHKNELVYMQIDVPVQPGNSGGPLVNEQGLVVGIVTSSAAIIPFFQTTGTLPQNVNWAVSGDFIRPFWPKDIDTAPAKNRDEAIDNVKRSICLIESYK